MQTGPVPHEPHSSDAPLQATIRDVARVAGVSLGSISNFLSGKAPVSDRHRARIEQAINELNYIPNSAVRVMRGARNPVVGFVIPDAGNPYFTEVARGIEDVAIEAGWVVVACNTNGESSREDHYADALSQMRVVGAIVTHQSASPHHLSQLSASGAAVILLGSEGGEFPAIGADDEHGGYIAVRHLIELGHRDIAFIGGPGGEAQIRARVRGATRALKEFGLEKPLRRVDAAGNSLAARVEAGQALLALRPLPTAVFCANDLIALAVQSSILNAGLRVPEDVAIIGYDDIDSAALGLRPISTIRQPQYELGVEAAKLVVALSQGRELSPSDQSFTPELVARSSTLGLAATV